MNKLIALIILFVSCSSHSAYRAWNANFSESQVNTLVEEIMTHTPEYTHYAKGYKFDWVLFILPNNDPYPAITTRLRSQLKKKYIVYDRESDLPAELVTYDPNDPVGAPIYRGGFRFSIDIRRLSMDTIEVTYEDFENSMAGGNQTIRYRWEGKQWKAIWESDLIVS